MQSWTVGKKLFSTLAVIFLLIGALLTLYLRQTYLSNQQLDRMLHVYNKKLDVGKSIELATTEMQGAQRGLMLSYMAKDPPSASQYTEAYAVSGKKIDSLLEELAPLATSEIEQAALGSVKQNRELWKPRFAELVDLCQSGALEKAYSLRSQNKVISAAMHAAAKTLVDEQQQSLAGAEKESAASLDQSVTIAIVAILVAIGVGILAYFLIRQITGRLRQMVDQLTDGARHLTDGASHVSASSQTIAQGTSEQASSIGETSAASEQISSMTRRNAQNATTASGLMRATTTLVEDANRSLDQMQRSMDAMNESSAKVGSIIKIIDQIAFQTNILALNAAVEAARAGEIGQGFSVVADEVRNLAQRSAQAAKDTTVLIEESLGKSHEGKAKLQLVATSIQAITASSARVSGLVDEVKHGSEEQAKGIELISTKMSQIERVTQNAAASAEEGAATGEQLQAQASSLYEIVRHLHAMVG